jgi:hypothetical protein
MMDGLGFELGLLQKGIKARRLFVTFTKGAKSFGRSTTSCGTTHHESELGDFKLGVGGMKEMD